MEVSPADAAELLTALAAELPPDPLAPPTRRPRRESVQWHWIRVFLAAKAPITPALKRSGLVLATYADSDGSNARPTIGRHAADLGKTPERVSKDRSKLTAAGWLHLVGGEHSTQDGIADVYRLDLPYDSAPPERPVKRWKARADGRPHVLPDAAADAKRRAVNDRASTWKSGWLKAVARCPAFSTPAVIVAGAMAVEASGWGTDVHCGWEVLMEATGLGRSAVLDALAQLREANAIQRIHSGSQDGRGPHDEYILADPRPDWIAAQVAAHQAAKDRLSAARTDAWRRRYERPGPGPQDAGNQVHGMTEPGPRNDRDQVHGMTGPGLQDDRDQVHGMPPYRARTTSLEDHAGIPVVDVTSSSAPAAEPSCTDLTADVSPEESAQALRAMSANLSAPWFPEVMAAVAGSPPGTDMPVAAYRLARHLGLIREGTDDAAT